ncbi:MAG TPA: type II toxin-antitoxin system ParD family antitoxin [Caulobacteraceae bacterium]|nr:type II toxin-antitoxin system ParD family antitoxin [Caulobacteraceae bacterium]
MASLKHLELDDESASIVDEALRSGEFGAAEDVVRAALKTWRAAEHRLTALRDAIEEGATSGPGVPAEQVFAELEARYRDISSRPA